MDQKFEDKLGRVAGKVDEKDNSESHTGTDDQEVDKLEEQDTNVPPETEQLEHTSNKDALTRTIDEMKKVSCLLFVHSVE